MYVKYALGGGGGTNGADLWNSGGEEGGFWNKYNNYQNVGANNIVSILLLNPVLNSM